MERFLGEVAPFLIRRDPDGGLFESKYLYI